MTYASCRIGKVTLKDPKLVALKPPPGTMRAIEYPWGQITFRLYDEAPITNADIVYMCEAVKESVMGGDNEKDFDDDVC